MQYSKLLGSLLRALACQIGGEVLYTELGNSLCLDHKTIQRYIELLEDAYVIFRLSPLSSNPRKEIVRWRKIYFYDNGVRNAIIGDFRPLNLRPDVGPLWENFIVSEMWKRARYFEPEACLYFWRGRNGGEIDLVIHRRGGYEAYEIKYRPHRAGRFPLGFRTTYRPHRTATIHIENFHQFLEPPNPHNE